MNQKKMSLVLPVYNVEKYLDDCLNSIINQPSFNEVEVIIVDDGSTDNSSKICDDYSKKYDNIITYHKSNGGLSSARNYGLLKSNTNYIFFIDSDDKISDNSIKDILNILKKDNWDVILFDAVCINDNDDIIDTNYKFVHYGLEDEKKYNGLELIKRQLDYNNDFKTPVWLGVYNKNFLLENSLFFENGVIHEDELWTPKTLLFSNKICYLKKDLYLYRIRNNSIMRDNEKNHYKHLTTQIYIFESLFPYFEKNIADKVLLKKINNCFVTRYLHSLTVNRIDQNSDLKKRISKIKLVKKSRTFKNFVRSLLLIINIRLYVFLTKKD